MLREDPSGVREEASGVRRWFASAEMDLIVWSKDGGIVAFQLCYDKRHDEHALTWRAQGPFRHVGVDDGEGLQSGRGMKASPVFVADGALDLNRIRDRFRREAELLEAPVREFVLDKLDRALGGELVVEK